MIIITPKKPWIILVIQKYINDKSYDVFKSLNIIYFNKILALNSRYDFKLLSKNLNLSRS